ncbi:MAG: cytochrome c oxidase accessory protein CcoG, partial [Flavobacteriales bacterium]
FVTPFIKIGGNPLLMFNVVERKFIIFGQIFWPQDLYIFALGMVILILFVSLFTVVYGRLFCGWICPQTIFMELVFRRIEYWIEGDWKQQKRLNDGPWTTDKWLKKISKQLIFWLISFVIANLFLSYIIGYEVLFQIISEPPSKHIGGFIAILVFTTLFYLVFSQMREQVCTVVCPYGRLQGVLLDDESLTVAYDYKRGEHRGRFKKNENRSDTDKGDCIDCGHCVNVCPTGIDIRNGTQLECVNCTACMDACDDIMDKVGLEQGLIRLTSTDRIEHKSKFRLTARMKAYSAVLVLLMCIMTALLLNRSDMEATILRTRGTLFQELEKGQISNLYDISLVNKTNLALPVEIKVLDRDAEIQLIGDPLHLNPQDEAKGKFMILIDKEDLESRKIKLELGVYSEGKLIEKVKTNFLGPQF